MFNSNEGGPAGGSAVWLWQNDGNLVALLQFLQWEDIAVSAFKAGPDFLDPMWQQAVTGRPAYNLDTHMMGAEACRDLFIIKAKGDFGLIEGVMGLFDGHSGVGGKGSGADLAHALGIPVWLVVDARGMSGSIVPLVSGFVDYAQRMNVTITGAIANRVGSERHAAMLAQHLKDAALPPLITWLDKNAPRLPERHLGLKMPGEVDIPDFSDSLHADQEKLLNAAGGIVLTPRNSASEKGLLKAKTIGIARDGACCFIYPRNLDWLHEQGATLVFFSPVAGEPVPEQVDAVWLPGGYPELHARALSNSTTWHSLRAHIEADKLVLAECGGMMLLGAMLTDHAGREWPMAGILPFTTKMQDRLAALGYREDATGVRGHEFHHSRREDHESFAPAFSLQSGDPGIRYRALRASYIHWYFAASPQVCAHWFGAQNNPAIGQGYAA